MATFKELKAQTAALEEQAAARAAECEEVLADIRGRVADYGFAEQDIFGRRRGGRATSARGVVPARYRDPKTGGDLVSSGIAFPALTSSLLRRTTGAVRRRHRGLNFIDTYF
jgi:DNA-binding protein H-NS